MNLADFTIEEVIYAGDDTVVARARSEHGDRVMLKYRLRLFAHSRANTSSSEAACMAPGFSARGSCADKDSQQEPGVLNCSVTEPTGAI